MCKKLVRILFICAMIFSFAESIDAQLVEKWTIEHKVDLSNYAVEQNQIPLSGQLEGDFDGDSVYSVVSYNVEESRITLEFKNGLTGKLEFKTDLESKYGSELLSVFIGDVDIDGLDELVLHYAMNSVVYDYDSPVSSIQSMDLTIPKEMKLEQNFPNPFNPSTRISFTLPKPGEVKIEIYNTLGQRVEILVNQYMLAGNHEVEFNAQNLSSGIYFYSIEAGEFHDVKKMILIR